MLNNRLTSVANGGLQISAPAKLNLGLRVFPPRADGFHDIESLFVPLAWHDTVTVFPAERLEFSVTGRTAGIPLEHDKNLITRAAILLAGHAGVEPRARIELHKILPPGGGLGGGSSDAASALLALDRMWGLGLEGTTLQGLAAELGSDVPFFITGTPALCTGRGEIVTPVSLAQGLFALLLIPPQGCPTKDVFQAFDSMLPAGSPPRIDWQNLATLPSDELNRKIINDLAAPAYRIAPWLRGLQRAAQEAIGQPVHLTGSGSTLFTLTSSAAQTTRLQQILTGVIDQSNAVIPTEILTS